MRKKERLLHKILREVGSLLDNNVYKEKVTSCIIQILHASKNLRMLLMYILLK